MIFFSSALVLSAGGTVSPNAPLIGWKNLVTAANISSDEEDPDFPVTNLANSITSSLWRGETDGAQTIAVAVATEDEIDYVAIARHNFGSTGRAVSIEIDGTLVCGPIMPADDDPLVLFFEGQAAASVNIVLAAASDVPMAAVVFVGKSLRLPQNINDGHTPSKFARQVRATNNFSESGQFQGRIVTGINVATAIALRNLDAAWYRAEMDPFVQAALGWKKPGGAISQGQPFFFAWRPQSYPGEVAFAVLTNNAQPVNQTAWLMSIDLQITGVA